MTSPEMRCLLYSTINSSDFGCQLSSPMVSSHIVRLHLPTSGVLSFRTKEADLLTGDAVSDRTKGPLFTRLPRRLTFSETGATYYFYLLLLPTSIGSGETVHNVLVLLTRLSPSRKILFPCLSDCVHSAGRSTL